MTRFSRSPLLRPSLLRPSLLRPGGLAALLLLAACAPDRTPPATGGASPPAAAAGEARSSAAPVESRGPVESRAPAASNAELIAPLESWGGGRGQVEIQSTMRATTAEEWETLWRLVGTRPPRPLAVGREVAAGVFLGERPTGGFGVEIVGLRRDAAGEGSADDGLIWREQRPPPGAAVTQILTYPWQIAVFPAEAIPTGFGRLR